MEVGRLRCLRGVDTLSAVGLCSEIGDFERFARAGQLMSYLGLVPSEQSSGESRRLGLDHSARARATPGGCLVEAAWHYRNRAPGLGAGFARGQEGQPARRRRSLGRRSGGLTGLVEDGADRGKRRTLVAVAVARELAGFCWAIARVE